jgi:hypothetical protein
MQLSLKNILLNNTTLKVTSFIIAFTGWSILHETSRITITTTVPVGLYQVPETYTLKAPEAVQISLMGTPAALQTVDLSELTLHLDGTLLHAGLNQITFTEANLLLPPHVNLVHYTMIPVFATPSIPAQQATASGALGNKQ